MPRRQSRKFGFELELNSSLPRNVLFNAVQAAASSQRMRYGTIESARIWTIKTDSSCGWELTSPALLANNTNFEKVRQFIITLKENIDNQIRSNSIRRSCGLHVHFQIDDLSHEQQKNMFNLFKNFEPHLLSLQPRSRTGNGYCRSIQNITFANNHENHGEIYSHFTGLNFGRYNHRKTIEIRYGAPSLRGRRVINWIQTLLLMIEHAKIVEEPISHTATTFDDFINFIRNARTQHDWLNSRKVGLSSWAIRRRNQLIEQNNNN